MTTAISLPTLTLSDSEENSVGLLRNRLVQVRAKNKIKSDLYEAKTPPEDLGIAAPQDLPDVINAVLAWPGTVVNAVDERLENRGWLGAYEDELAAVYRDNHMDVESGRCHLDALIYGVGFVTVGRGDVAAGEPEVLVTAESTETCTVEWDYRLRRAVSALSQTHDDNGNVIMETLYLPNETIRFERGLGGRLSVVGRDSHGLGRVPVARMLNQDRASDVRGRSEITRPIAYATRAAARTLSGMEINREFYTSPKWTILNADPEVFGLSEENSPEKNARAGWKATQGNMNVVPPQLDEEGNPVTPQMHEFRPASPAPYIDQIRMYGDMVCSASSLPHYYLGFRTENPPSADSIRQQEAPLAKRAERRQRSFGHSWLEVALLSLRISGVDVDPVAFRDVNVDWRDPYTPTRSAAADEAVKLIGANVLTSASKVTMDRVGLSPQEQQQLRTEQRAADGGGLLEAIMSRQGEPDAAVAQDAQELKLKADAMGAMIRAGVKPDVAAAKAGLDGLEFLDGGPITLKYDDGQ